jgi:hypothetical protein
MAVKVGSQACDWRKKYLKTRRTTGPGKRRLGGVVVSVAQQTDSVRVADAADGHD